ncbi:Cytochrome P450 monooxygenase himC [Hyphodiscus hymeniophilus]|uniref:Cytochrome P450 monooxygenase himC n=1 Tax=Hyphodiscus hymeniophilus TaxID=353542 RepID=A0A9P6SPF7_9HELO|nr:Cytochrome P450 monooxygenase himC [Hyphodiscus hymeniophilus]
MPGLQDFPKERSPSVLALFAFGGIYVLYILFTRFISWQRHSRIIRDNGCKPVAKYPHKDPIFGLDVLKISIKLSKEGGMWDAFEKRYQSINGGVNTFSQRMMGAEEINTAEPENIKAMLATKFKDFELPPGRKAAFQPIFGHGIFTTDDAEWEASRALLRPNFIRTQIADLRMFEHHVSRMISKIPHDGSTVDLQKLFFMLTIDSATEFLFGTSSNVLGTGEDTVKGEKFADAFGYVTDRIGFKNRIGKLGVLFPDPKWKTSVEYVHEYVQKYVQDAATKRKLHVAEKGKADDEQAERYVFLNELAKTGYGEKKIQDELLNILLAGRDTTASLLSFLWHIFARRPDVFDKVRAEVLKLGSDSPTFEQVKDMKYLQYCMNETLRLYPIVPANGRSAVRDTTLPVGGGPDGKSPILVKKGQRVSYHVYVMHRREDLYGPDAAEFRPERWETLRPSWQYLPFNGGPRICIGQQFALTEASYTTIRLLQAFKKIEPREFTPILELQTLTMAVRAGVQVGLTPA